MAGSIAFSPSRHCCHSNCSGLCSRFAGSYHVTFDNLPWGLPRMWVVDPPTAPINNSTWAGCLSSPVGAYGRDYDIVLWRVADGGVYVMEGPGRIYGVLQLFFKAPLANVGKPGVMPRLCVQLNVTMGWVVTELGPWVHHPGLTEWNVGYRCPATAVMACIGINEPLGFSHVSNWSKALTGSDDCSEFDPEDMVLDLDNQSGTYSPEFCVPPHPPTRLPGSCQCTVRATP